MKWIAALCLSFVLNKGISQSDAFFVRVPGVDMAKAVSGLLKHGYSIERSEANMNIIVTHMQAFEDIQASIIFKARIKDGTLILSGEYSEFDDKNACKPVVNSRNSSDLEKKCWDIMVDLSQKIKAS